MRGLSTVGRAVNTVKDKFRSPRKKSPSGDGSSSPPVAARSRFNLSKKVKIGTILELAASSSPTETNGGTDASNRTGTTPISIPGLSKAYMQPYVQDVPDEGDDYRGQQHGEEQGTGMKPAAKGRHLPSVVMGDFLDNHAANVQGHLDDREVPPASMDRCPKIADGPQYDALE
ncbi:hypothetical protein C8T65DRAFT_745510 [Cerioporus squamosus]|nr:hypothetical protein C8T65DRAFT_745510 [Cerioporus squamosus]